MLLGRIFCQKKKAGHCCKHGDKNSEFRVVANKAMRQYFAGQVCIRRVGSPSQWSRGPQSLGNRRTKGSENNRIRDQGNPAKLENLWPPWLALPQSFVGAPRRPSKGIERSRGSLLGGGFRTSFRYLFRILWGIACCKLAEVRNQSIGFASVFHVSLNLRNRERKKQRARRRKQQAETNRREAKSNQ